MITYDQIKPKIIRLFIAAMVFLPMMDIFKVEARLAQAMILALCVAGVFALVIRNLWVGLFLIWTIFLFAFYQFQVGQEYVTNILWGTMLYFICSVYFKRKHVDFFLNIVLWLTAINLFYMIAQTLGFDKCFANHIIFPGRIEWTQTNDPAGFMRFKGGMGMLMVIAQAILLPRKGWLPKVAALGLFVTIYISRASICLISGAVLCIFNFWQNAVYVRMGRYFVHRGWILGVLLIATITGCTLFSTKIDDFSTSFKTRADQWAICLRDSTMHPVTGWGLDSFRNVTPWKPFTYRCNYAQKKDAVSGKEYISMDNWDNPHNLFLSLIFEWGVPGVLILIGYLRWLVLSFEKSDKGRDILALAGIIMAVVIMSLAQFPMWLARFVVIIVPVAALFEVATIKTEER